LKGEKHVYYQDVYKLLPTLKNDEKITVEGSVKEVSKAHFAIRSRLQIKSYRGHFTLLRKSERRLIIIRKKTKLI